MEYPTFVQTHLIYRSYVWKNIGELIIHPVQMAGYPSDRPNKSPSTISPTKPEVPVTQTCLAGLASVPEPEYCQENLKWNKQEPMILSLLSTKWKQKKNGYTPSWLPNQNI